MSEIVLREDKLAQHPAADQVLLNDSFQHVRPCRVIPHAFRIDDGDRPLMAHSQAIRLRAIDGFIRLREA